MKKQNVKVAKELMKIARMLKASKQCQGECPCCGSKNIEYIDQDIDGVEQIGYEAECDDCGCTFTEWYSLNYVETIADDED
ncbi:MAG: hypothetical protein IKP65_03120 [Alphaproteobacteria bacterium]|nr:hypothetical protein [Alphaproteobacteria bacterium]